MSHNYTRTRDIPIFDDIVQGRGGIAGGRFTTRSDITNPVSLQYVTPNYVVGQGGYISGDVY